MVGFTFLQSEELESVDWQVVIMSILCILLGQGLWRTLKKQNIGLLLKTPSLCSYDHRCMHILKSSPGHHWCLVCGCRLKEMLQAVWRMETLAGEFVVREGSLREVAPSCFSKEREAFSHREKVGIAHGGRHF